VPFLDRRPHEKTEIQMDYAIDESQRMKKGPNTGEISILHNDIFHQVPKGKSIILDADNCCGNNKNQTVIEYLCYLTQILRRHHCILLNFMVVGHPEI